jgi:hypothetical protein
MKTRVIGEITVPKKQQIRHDCKFIWSTGTELLLLLRWGETMSLWNWVSNEPFTHPPDDIWVNMEQRWNDNGRKTEGLREKPVPVSLCPPQIPPGLIWPRTRASTVRSRRLTAWAMARPEVSSYRLLFCHFALLVTNIGHLWIHSVRGSVRALIRQRCKERKIPIIVLRFLHSI